MNKIAVSIGGSLLGAGHPFTQMSGVSDLVYIISSNAVMIAGVILVIIIIYSGISMITASGDPQQFAKAQSILTSGIIGFVIVIAAWFIIKIIEASTGISIVS